MNYAIPISSVTVIIAYRGSDRHLLGTFNSLKMWFDNITIVGPNVVAISEEIKTHGGNWLETESSNICELWEKGIQSKKSSWYLLLEGREYFSTVLKESICETIKLTPVQRTWFPVKRNIFFLKQRLKYPLEWTHDPRSGLLFSGTDKQEIKIRPLSFFRENHLQGESIYFSENTLAEVVANIVQRSEYGADQLYQINPHRNLYSLFLRALTASAEKFYKNWILRKGIREGFEGFVFCLLDSIVILLGYLRYYEKYIRSGKQIENERTLIKKILVIKIRGLGDAVLATPVFKNLKALMPNVSISVLTFNFCKPLFENNPNVDDIHGLSGNPSSNEIKKIIKALSDKKFDLIVNLHSRNFSSKLAQKIKSDWKINRSYFIREKYTDVMIGSDHELDKTSIERDLDCIRVLGLDPVDKEPELFVTEEEEQWAKEKLKNLKVDPVKKLIMIHPACSQNHKSWGMERFVKLSRHLINDCGYQIMGIFSSQEQSVADLLEEEVDGVFIYVGPIRPSMALIEQADLMIDNCSGPSHISVALQVPTIVLMGVDFKNTYRDENIYKGKHFLFFREVSCRDLFLSKCLPPDPCQNRICMDHSVEAVFAKAKELLKKPSINLK
jgi:ADP-heptose:LPS heptosyltransferase